MEDKNPIAALVPTPRCPECGYSREGLELLQVCPECGWQPRADEIVLWGYGHGMKRNLSNTPVRLFRRNLIFTSLAVLAYAYYESRRNPVFFRPDFLIPFILIWIAPMIWQLVRRTPLIRELDQPELARFTPNGFGQRTGTGKIKLTKWRRAKQITVGRDVSNRLIVRCTPRFFSFAPSIDIELRETTVDEWQLRNQLERWHQATRSTSPGRRR